jgi:hydrogenase-1 operon protein HyaF
MNMAASTSRFPLEIIGARRPAPSFDCGDILREVETKLAALVATGQASAVDLGCRPIGAAEYRQLRLALTPGRVSAVVTEPKRCEVLETIYPGVWWVTHYANREAVSAEAIEVAFATDSIEISFVPSILCSSNEDIARGLRRLSTFACDGEARPRRCCGAAHG